MPLCSTGLRKQDETTVWGAGLPGPRQPELTPETLDSWGPGPTRNVRNCREEELVVGILVTPQSVGRVAATHRWPPEVYANDLIGGEAGRSAFDSASCDVGARVVAGGVVLPGTARLRGDGFGAGRGVADHGGDHGRWCLQQHFA